MGKIVIGQKYKLDKMANFEKKKKKWKVGKIQTWTKMKIGYKWKLDRIEIGKQWKIGYLNLDKIDQRGKNHMSVFFKRYIPYQLCMTFVWPPLNLKIHRGEKREKKNKMITQ